MGTLYFLMGKSSTGKDSIYKNLLTRKDISLKGIVGYTTRPIRSHEVNGRDYYFCSKEEKDAFLKENKVIELRTYPTVHGDWEYFTVDDGQIGFEDGDMLMVGTLESYNKLKEYFKGCQIHPIYIEVEDGIRIQRALDREKQQENPKYEEMCRRFLADASDFASDKLKNAGITRSFKNVDIDIVTQEIVEWILK